jgi:tripartite ATP-independent transporter DctM subunit
VSGDWALTLSLFIGSIVGLMMLGMPVAIAFLLVNMVAAFLIMRSFDGVMQVVDNATDLLTSYILAPVPLFLLMGALFFHTGLAYRMFAALDQLLGRLPGRLSFLTVIGGTGFSTLTGSSLANAAMLGSLLVPEMKKRGYSMHMSLGPILGTGGLAILIPPSALIVLLGSVAQVDVGKLLLAGVLPGFVLAALYAATIAIQIMVNPAAAPSYDPPRVALAEKLKTIAINIIPMLAIVLVVVGMIVGGLATPTESAAFGVTAVVALAFAYRSMTMDAVRKSLHSTVVVSGSLFFILVGSSVFSQILAFSGASNGFMAWATGLSDNRYLLLLFMFCVLIVLGMFMDQVSMMLIAVPVMFPLAAQLGFDPVWFGIVFLMAMEMSLTTPPFGLLLFIVKGMAPPGTSFGEVVRAALPFLAADAALVLLLVLFPALALWLPSQM